MHLASVSELRAQLGFDDMTDINTAIGDALDAAETQLASILRTDFNFVNVVDQFFIEDTPQMGRAVKTELLLTRGFLTAQPVTVVTQEISPLFLFADDIVQANYSGTGGPLPNFIFGLEKGHGVDTTNLYESAFVNVSYSAGFHVDPTIAGQYDLTTVPSWLQTAAKQMAVIMLADNAVITSSGIVIDKALNKQQSQLLLQSKVRYKPLALDPFSEPMFS